MASTGKPLEFFPASTHNRPPTESLGEIEGREMFMWYITEDEYFRLSKLLRRNFQHTGLGGTRVYGLPAPCPGCGKYQEFIDWVWTAIVRSVHSREFIFNALVKSRQGTETQHDVYCSECGTLTLKRRKDTSEGGAPDIYQAREIKIANYQPTPRQPDNNPKAVAPPVEWGRWWLDDNGKCLVSKYGDTVPPISA